MLLLSTITKKAIRVSKTAIAWLYEGDIVFSTESYTPYGEPYIRFKRCNYIRDIKAKPCSIVDKDYLKELLKRA